MSYSFSASGNEFRARVMQQSLLASLFAGAIVYGYIKTGHQYWDLALAIALLLGSLRVRLFWVTQLGLLGSEYVLTGDTLLFRPEAGSSISIPLHQLTAWHFHIQGSCVSNYPRVLCRLSRKRQANAVLLSILMRGAFIKRDHDSVKLPLGFRILREEASEAKALLAFLTQLRDSILAARRVL